MNYVQTHQDGDTLSHTLVIKASHGTYFKDYSDHDHASLVLENGGVPEGAVFVPKVLTNLRLVDSATSTLRFIGGTTNTGTPKVRYGVYSAASGYRIMQTIYGDHGDGADAVYMTGETATLNEAVELIDSTERHRLCLDCPKVTV